MKIQAIATLVTAATVSFFPTDPSSQDAANATGSPAASVAVDSNDAHWELVSGESADYQLYQSDGGELLDDPLSADPEGGFSAGGVVELTESVTNEEIVDFGDPQGMVVDSVAPTRVKTGVSVGEVRVAPVDAAIAAIEEQIEAAADAAEVEEMALDVVVEEPEVVDLAEAPAIEEPVGESESADEPEVATVIVNGEEVEEGATSEVARPSFPTMASSAAKEIEEPEGGFADRLVNKVSQAVGGGPSEEEQADADAAANEPTMGEDEGGFWLRGARLNDVFQYLARLGNMQYFHNADLDAANFAVTGHLSEGDPVEQMAELGLMYGITIHEKGQTVYAMTDAQLAQLPTKPFYYHLKYLRPSDIDQIKGILSPLMTPGSGSVDFEQKTNTLIFIDNEQRIESIQEILAELDKPKKQIAIETRILRIKSGSQNRLGVDWESVLGDGMTISGIESLNTLFNLPDSDMIEQVITTTLSGTAASPFTVSNVKTPQERTEYGDITGSNFLDYNDETTRTINSTESQLVLSPLQLQATLRALNTGGLAQQESSPTLITEDNEAGIISIIDRIPIIIATVSETSAGQNISEEVRYRIDVDDPSYSDDPAATREIGVTVAVTPTILPDDTIRMALRPRSAQIVEFIQGRSGNSYPRVNESTVDTIARIPNGYSLLIGGFYEEQESDHTKKVPVLGDVPGLNFMFKSTDTIKEQTSLVFVVTPKMYEPAIFQEVERVNGELHDNHVLPTDHKWPDRRNPGSNYEPNLGWSLGNAVNAYPATPPSNPLNPEHPVNLPEWDVRDEGGIRPGETMVEPVAEAPRRKGLFGQLFKKRKR